MVIPITILTQEQKVKIAEMLKANNGVAYIARTLNVPYSHVANYKRNHKDELFKNNTVSAGAVEQDSIPTANNDIPIKPNSNIEVAPVKTDDNEVASSPSIDVNADEGDKTNDTAPSNERRITIGSDEDAVEIDMEELNSMPADTLNSYFASKSLSTLTQEERDKLTKHTGVMLKKRLPKILYKYGDVINVLLSGGKIVYKRVNQANEIAAKRKLYMEQQKIQKAAEATKSASTTKSEPQKPVDNGYSGAELEALQKKYNLIKQ